MLNYSKSIVSFGGQHEETIRFRNGGHIEAIDTMDLGFPIGLDGEIADFISHASPRANDRSPVAPKALFQDLRMTNGLL